MKTAEESHKKRAMKSYDFMALYTGESNRRCYSMPNTCSHRLRGCLHLIDTFGQMRNLAGCIFLVNSPFSAGLGDNRDSVF